MIKAFEVDTLNWNFDSSESAVTLKMQTEGLWTRLERVDPFPCYPHDFELVQKQLDGINRVAPLGVNASFFVSHYESTSRVNGWATYNERKELWEGYVFLSGKRTSIHPAMTRFIVCHEYGHLVEYRLGQLMFPERFKQNGLLGCHEEMEKAYLQVRDIPEEYRNLPYGSKTHHLVWNEIFANDFRYHVMKCEQEFWIHPVDPIGEPGTEKAEMWWEKAVNLLKGNA